MTDKHALHNEANATEERMSNNDITTDRNTEIGTLDVSRYVDGYRPVSFVAPHSSLLKSITWLGMGLILAALAGLGTLVYGLAGGAPTQNSAMITIGIILTVILVVAGFGCVYLGRRDWHKFSKETGYKH